MLAKQQEDKRRRISERKAQGLGTTTTAHTHTTGSNTHTGTSADDLNSFAEGSIATDDSAAQHQHQHHKADTYENKYGVLDADTYALFSSYFHCLGNVLSFPRICTHRDIGLWREVLSVSAQYAETGKEMPYPARSGQGMYVYGGHPFIVMLFLACL